MTLLGRTIIVGMAILIAGCAAYQATLRARADPADVDAFRRMSEDIARSYDMGSHPPGDTEVREGQWRVLGDFRRAKPEARGASGSKHYLLLFVLESRDSDLIQAELYDFDSGRETEFTRRIRQDLEERMRRLAPDGHVEVTQKRIRAMAP